MEKEQYKFLYDINSPCDLRKLNEADLSQVCDEVRNFMIDTITQTGGHFGAGLGVVELTVALHYIFNTPEDQIVWDVGHQGYPHKILTGRRDSLHTIRKKDGLSGFLKISESEYDSFGAGHASTSISAALGLATARDLLNKTNKVIAVIGDGSLTGGMAYEAMNNCGVQKRDIIVILNDNNISIDPNVSAFSNYFNEVFASSTFRKMRENIWQVTGRLDSLGDRIRRVASKLEGGVKAIVTPGILFEAMGFNYFGPINGNNIKQLIKMLKSIKDMHGPILFHIITSKGKGYAPAENDFHHFHAIGKIDKETGKALPKINDNEIPTYSSVFGLSLLEMFRDDNKLVAVTAAMADGTGLDIVDAEFPERVFDVGIAEEHAVTYAAGMAKAGIIPIVAIYSSFLQRAIDQVAHDVALQNLHVVFAIDRAGLVGEDGPTHHGVLDIAFLRAIPNMILMAPMDEQELRNMLFSAIYEYHGPVAIRFPRGKGLGVATKSFKKIALGSWKVLKNGKNFAIFVSGKTVNNALKAADILSKHGFDIEVINARFIKPLDYSLIDEISENFDYILTIEDGNMHGGFGSAVLEYLSGKSNIKSKVYLHGIPDRFMEHGTQDELYEELNLHPQGIADKVLSIIKNG